MPKNKNNTIVDPVAAFPLLWPKGRPRTGAEHIRFSAPFRKNFAGAYDAVFDELTRFGRTHAVTDAKITTNVLLRTDGLPALPAARTVRGFDAAVAIYFDRADRTYAVSCDTYGAVHWNLAAIAKKLAGLRSDLRDGVKTTEDALAGYLALPEPREVPWHEVLGVAPTASSADIERAYNTLLRKVHPDVSGGSTEAFIQLQQARVAATMHLSRVATAHRAESAFTIGVSRIG